VLAADGRSRLIDWAATLRHIKSMQRMQHCKFSLVFNNARHKGQEELYRSAPMMKDLLLQSDSSTLLAVCKPLILSQQQDKLLATKQKSSQQAN